jgi:hypothetical protein
MPLTSLKGGVRMEKFVPYQKLSKKKKRELDLKRRQTWAVSPVTRKAQNKKVYNRKKTRKEDLYDFTDAFFLFAFFQKKP